MVKHIAEDIQMTSDVNISMNNAKITGSGAPSGSTDLEIKSGVDAKIKERWFPMGTGAGSVYNSFKSTALTTSDTEYITIKIPYNFRTLVSCYLYYAPAQAGALGSGKDVDLNTDYAAVGEDYNNHSESDTSSTYDFGSTLYQFRKISLAGVLTAITAGDWVGIKITSTTTGGAIFLQGVSLKYT